jgi:hypothetical protein
LEGWLLGEFMGVAGYGGVVADGSGLDAAYAVSRSLRPVRGSVRPIGAPLAESMFLVGCGPNPAMTRHYTHVGELAAGQAVAALPSVMGEAAPAAAGGQEGPEAVLEKLRGVLEGMSAANWQEKRAEAAVLLSRSQLSLGCALGRDVRKWAAKP